MLSKLVETKLACKPTVLSEAKRHRCQSLQRAELKKRGVLNLAALRLRVPVLLKGRQTGCWLVATPSQLQVAPSAPRLGASCAVFLAKCALNL
jgi:hypothetical protein